MEDSRVVRICKALSDVNRLHIIQALTKGEQCACELLENLQITQPTLSHHMKILTEADLVVCRKEGKWTYYALDCDVLTEYREFIATLRCSQGNSGGKGACCK
jgi:ArsR family transcriptional regulator